MVLWSLEPQYQINDPVNDFKPYYWTNVYYWQQSGASSPDSDIVNRLEAITWGMVAQSVRRLCYRVRCAASGYDVTVSDPQYGTWDSAGSLYLVPWCVYIGGYGNDGELVAYKRLRGGYHVEDASGPVWGSALLTWLQTWIVDQWRLVPLCNHLGVVPVSWEIDPAIHLWQQRHGSKRAARPVYAIP